MPRLAVYLRYASQPTPRRVVRRPPGLASPGRYCSNDDGDDCTTDDSSMRKGLPALGARFFALEPLFKQVRRHPVTARLARIVVQCWGVCENCKVFHSIVHRCSALMGVCLSTIVHGPVPPRRSVLRRRHAAFWPSDRSVGARGLAVASQYAVDLAFWAHEHSYERLWPTYDGVVYNGTENPGELADA